MALYTRQELAKDLVKEASSNGGALGVRVLLDECRAFLDSASPGTQRVIQYDPILIECFRRENGMFFLTDRRTGEIVGKERLSQLGSWLYRETRQREKFDES